MGEMRELIDTELDAVCGGSFAFDNIIAQVNLASQNVTRNKIADAIGCCVTTLVGRCSAEGITLPRKPPRFRFTPEILARIPEMVEAGMKKKDIAVELGCTVSSLIVTCSRKGISLRKGGPFLPPRTLAIEVAPLPLTQETLRALRMHAREKGVDEVQLVTDLVSIIVEDKLFDAVLDK